MADSYWGDPTIEPKRKFKWILQIGGLPAWVVKAASKPKWSMDVAEHKFLMHTFKFPGQVTWENIEVTLVDPLTPDVVKTIETIIKNSGYEVPDAYRETTISKRQGVRALNGCKIQIINADETVTEEWTLSNAWISDVDYGGDLSYEDNGLQEVKITIAFDYAELTKSEAPFGS